MNLHEGLIEPRPLFAEARGDVQVSFEFFPPKTETKRGWSGARV